MPESIHEPTGCEVITRAKIKFIANFIGSIVNYVQNGGIANDMKNKRKE